MNTLTYALDTTGASPSNLTPGESHALTSTTGSAHYFITPHYAPFFADSLKLGFRGIGGETRILVEGIDYYPCFEFISASVSCKKRIFGGIAFNDSAINGVVDISPYQTLGGGWGNISPVTLETIAQLGLSPRVASWEQISGLPTIFPPASHSENINDITDVDDLLNAIAALTQEVAKPKAPNAPTLQLYQTKQQVGLGLVDNFATSSDQEAIAGVSKTLFSTPHGVALKLKHELERFMLTFMPQFKAAAMPTSGNFNAGNYVANTAPSLKTWQGSTTTSKLHGVTYVVKGWVRVTTGSNHVLGTDWVEDRAIVRD